MAPSPNLALRPGRPAAGRGHVQVGVKRAFLATGKSVLSTSELLAWTHSRPIWVRRHNLRQFSPELEGYRGKSGLGPSGADSSKCNS
jgi:hypothetical protein